METSEFRALVMGLGEVSAAPHFDRVAFRTPRRTFVTLSSDGADANVCLEPDHQALLVERRPEVFEPVAGGWGRMGWTRMWIARATVEDARHALVIAHGLAQPVAKRGRKRADAARADADGRAPARAKSKRAAVDAGAQGRGAAVQREDAGAQGRGAAAPSKRAASKAAVAASKPTRGPRSR